MELTRKCKICGKNIFIERDRSTFFYDKTGFYHKDCFVEKKKNQKREQLPPYYHALVVGLD